MNISILIVLFIIAVCVGYFFDYRKAKQDNRKIDKEVVFLFIVDLVLNPLIMFIVGYMLITYVF